MRHTFFVDLPWKQKKQMMREAKEVHLRLRARREEEKDKDTADLLRVLSFKAEMTQRLHCSRLGVPQLKPRG